MLNTYFIVSIIVLAMVLLGFLIGLRVGQSQIRENGQIILCKNEEGEDKIIFQLGMEYDDIADHDYVIFKVRK
jgi:hypothetical protein